MITPSLQGFFKKLNCYGKTNSSKRQLFPHFYIYFFRFAGAEIYVFFVIPITAFCSYEPVLPGFETRKRVVPAAVRCRGFPERFIPERYRYPIQRQVVFLVLYLAEDAGRLCCLGPSNIFCYGAQGIHPYFSGCRIVSPPR